ncbi:MAG: VWA domain-containing protein [Acidobacteriota bacterium]
MVTFLGGIREERKAVIVVSGGWHLFRPNARLARPLRGRVPGLPPIGVDPRTGKLGTTDPNSAGGASLAECDADRAMLSQLDNARDFQRLPGLANRANVSFYPIDPAGLRLTGMMGRNLDTLRVLADETDGLAIVGTNDLSGGAKRITDDLSSYYVLGYYSTNTTLDGGYRRITVRVKRPGVHVRARRGYLAPAAAEIASAGRAPRRRRPWNRAPSRTHWRHS